MTSVEIISKHLIHPMGTTQLRCVQPAEYMRKRGFSVITGCIYRSIPKRGDVSIFHRVVADRYTLKYIEYAKCLGHLVIYDTDDLLFDKDGLEYLSTIGKNSANNTKEYYRLAMKKSDIVTVSTQFLANRAEEFHSKVYVLRNALSADYCMQADKVYSTYKYPRGKFFTVAYLSGSSSHDDDFRVVEAALLRLLRENDSFKVLLVGDLNYTSEFKEYGLRFEHRKTIPYSEYTQVFSEIDINLIPLKSVSFNHAKSELKYIEAAACGVPSIASRTETHKEIITHNVDGILVTDGEWYSAIKDLLLNHKKHASIGENARKRTYLEYAPSVRAEEWARFIRQVTSNVDLKDECSIFKRIILLSELQALRAWRVFRRRINV